MYGKLPEVICNISIPGTEFLSYQYLPVKLSCQDTLIRRDIAYINLEPRLEPFRKIIDICVDDFFGKDKIKLYNYYIYLTVKRQYQKDKGFNRAGWHSDGFLTDDINYIWCDRQPTIFNNSNFNLSKDDQKSLIEMEEQAKPENNVVYPNNTLLKLDQSVIHKVGPIETGVRTFVKVSISKDRYDLEGNAHNYELNYNWCMRKRNNSRNVPQELRNG